MDTGQVRIPVREIKLGVACLSDIRNSEGILLLGRGERINQAFRDQLLERGIDFIEVDRAQAAGLLGKNRVRARISNKSGSGYAFLNQRIDRSNEAYSKERALKVGETVNSCVSSIAAAGKDVKKLSDEEMRSLCEIPSQMLSMILDDADLTIAKMASGAQFDLLADRCTRMSILATGTAVELELSYDEVVTTGTAALLHDLGLFLFEPRFRDTQVTLSEEEKWKYVRHPFVSRDLLLDFPSVSLEVGMIVSQVHERPDGGGFPRGLRGNHLHPLTKIVGLVDAYISLTDPGPGRPPLKPHDALRIMLHEVSRGGLDSKVMRAFLTQLGLFPIGTRVLLSNEQPATVVRRDGAHYATPIVQIEGTQDTIPLRSADIKVVEALAEPSRKEMSLPDELFSELTFDSLLTV